MSTFRSPGWCAHTRTRACSIGRSPTGTSASGRSAWSASCWTAAPTPSGPRRAIRRSRVVPGGCRCIATSGWTPPNSSTMPRSDLRTRALPTAQILDVALHSAVLLSAVLLVGGCGKESRARAQRVVLITCDTLRADRLGIYGYERETSPNLDAFARESVVFDNAWSSAPLTAPALATLMTGRLPDELGMSSNEVVLPGEVTTLAEAASEAGIPSAAVVSNWVVRARGVSGEGFEQGFASYDDRMEEREPNRRLYNERSAAATTRAAIEWLASARRDRFFLWVHYQDPHGPYTPPEPFVRLLQRPIPDEPLLGVGKTDKGLGEIPRYQELGLERAPEFYRIRYDAEIRSFDHALGQLLDHLRSEGLLDGTL